MRIEQVTKKREEIFEIARKHGAKNIRIFGSIARGDTVPGSDIDFLVDMEHGRSLLDLGGLWWDLHEALGREVDVVTENSLRERMRARVLREAVPL